MLSAACLPPLWFAQVTLRAVAVKPDGDGNALGRHPVHMDRYWLLTWTTYGTWLPGDPRGSTLRVPDVDGDGRSRTFLRLKGEGGRARGLARSAARRMTGPPARLTADEARVVLDEIRSQARFRRWALPACAVMANHVHAVVGLGPDEEPSRALHAFKAYASRALNDRRGRPAGGTWWTQSGSTQRLRWEANGVAAVRYVREQPYPLAVWIAPGVDPTGGGG